MLESGFRAVCIREIQKSLDQSVKADIAKQIEKFGLGSMFRVTDKKIITPGDGLIIFMGMQDHTAESVKSLANFDVAWVEEAQSLSKHSLRVLRPTIRKPGSELWFSWNPSNPDDPVDEFFRKPNVDRPNAICVEVNWRDNPWFPEGLIGDRLDDLRYRLDEYDHIWEGAYLTISDAQIFKGKVSVERFETPEDARFFHGADWGFSVDPTTLVRCFIDEASNTLFVDHEAYGVGVELDDIPAFFDRVPTSRQWPIRADNSQPSTISYIGRQGFSIAGADKWPGSVEDGITHLKGFRRIVVHERCEHTAREFRRYSWKVDARNGQVLPVIVDKFNHCIAAGQLITTARGNIPVEDVRVGDLALTREGFKRVYAARQTSDDREWWQLSAGAMNLLATPNHEVITANRGLVRVDELRYTDEVFISGGLSSPSQTRFRLKVWSMAVAAGIAIQTHLTSLIATIIEAAFLTATHYTCIKSSGWSISVLYLQDVIFTTKTKTPVTTTQTTLNALRPLSIKSVIPTQWTCADGDWGILKRYGPLLLLGTAAKKARNCIAKMGKPFGHRSSRFLANAISVKRFIKRQSLESISSAQMPARPPPGERLGWMTKIASVRNAVAPSDATNILKSGFVLARVQCVRDTGKRGPVYDLSIEGQPEFIASGILVHNCIDAIRYSLDGYIQARGGAGIWARLAG